MGISWHSPAKASLEFTELLDNAGRLLVRDARGLSCDEYRELRRMEAIVIRWCEELGYSEIPLSIQCDDPSDANVCCNGNGLTAIDWADAHVGYPFGSLIFPLRTFREQHGLPVGHPDVVALADTYLEAWDDLSDRESPRHLKGLVMRVAVVSKALSWTRDLLGLDRAALNAYYASPEACLLRKLLYGGLPY